jgi:hypothetical protein
MDNINSQTPLSKKKRKLKRYIKGYLILIGVFLFSLACISRFYSMSMTNLNNELVKANQEVKKTKAILKS